MTTALLAARPELVENRATMLDGIWRAAGPAGPALATDMRSEFDDAEIAELATGVALAHGFSKLLITLGLEPEEMATIVARTPDVPS